MNILKSKHLNDWPLFYWIAALNSLAVIGYMLTQDLSVPRGLSEMIQWTVRLCVPLLFLAFAASSIAQLVSGSFSRWLLRNRRYFGLGFAFGFAWQMTFILWLFFAQRDYYMENVFGATDLIYRYLPYTLLTAMTITSFHGVRKKINRDVWRALHWVGIYYLWYVVEITYWYEITDPKYHDPIDYVYVTLGGLAYLARVFVWFRDRDWTRIGARMIRAAKLDTRLHQGAGADRGVMPDAMTAIVLSAVAVGIGNLVYLDGGFQEIIGGTAGGLHHVARDTVLVLAGWYLWTYLIHFIGTRLLRDTDTRADYGAFLRTVGFASAPGLIGLFAIIPGLTPFAFTIAGGWVLVAMVIAVRQALNFQSTGRAFGVCVIGSAAQVLIVVVAGSILGSS